MGNDPVEKDSFGRTWNSSRRASSRVRHWGSVTAGLFALIGILTTVASGQLFELVSPNEEMLGWFGFSVSGVPDVNGDGRGDILVGANGESLGGTPQCAGRVYIIAGSDGALLSTLASPNEEAFSEFGRSISGVLDVDGDGRGDVIVGAQNEDPGTSPDMAGRAYIFSGSGGVLLSTLVSPNEETGGWFGSAVSGVPDVDGDGRGDVIVGAQYEDPGTSPDNAGRAYIFSGSDGTLLSTLVSPNEEYGGYFGHSVSGVPDVDGDGRGDVVVGAYWENPVGSPTNAGRAYVFSASNGMLLSTLVSPNEEIGGFFGYSVSGVPDVNGDGRGDVIAGAYREAPGTSPDMAGRAYIFSGSGGALLSTLFSPNEEREGHFGYSVSGVPDVDGDGWGDVVVGEREYNMAGCAYIFSGSDGVLMSSLVSPNREPYGDFGYSVSGVPDVDGDGWGDIIAGAPSEDPGASPDSAGRAYIFSGFEEVFPPTPTPSSTPTETLTPGPTSTETLTPTPSSTPTPTSTGPTPTPTATLEPGTLSVAFVDEDAPPGGDGSSWGSALRTIEAGIYVVAPGGEVWVAEGVYSESFLMASDVALYGGFAATESLRSERNFALHVTTIDGSMVSFSLVPCGGDLIQCSAIGLCNVDNSRIDGFTISGVDPSSYGSWKGGVHYIGSDHTNTIANCIIERNGGGILLENSSPTIQDCTITENASYYGGIMCIDSSAVISNCVISRNSRNTTANSGGGGIYGVNSSLLISDCIIFDNMATEAIADGGGIYLTDSSILNITNCLISKNKCSRSGGGIACEELSTGTISNCTIENNCADLLMLSGQGGGIYIDLSPSFVISNCTITGNVRGGVFIVHSDVGILGNKICGNTIGRGLYWYASFGPICNVQNSIISGNVGGGGYFWGDATLTNCIVSGNVNTWESGGGLSLFSSGGPRPTLLNCTISSNTTSGVPSTIPGEGEGGGIYCGGQVDITNCIFEHNSQNAIWEAGSWDDVYISNCLFHNNPDGDYLDVGTGSVLTGAIEINGAAGAFANIDGDPLFAVGESGTWTAAPVFLPDTTRTVLTDAAASFTPGEFAGRLINPDTSEPMQALVTANSATTIEIVWNLNLFNYLEIGDAYEIIDYHLTGSSPCVNAGTEQGVCRIPFMFGGCLDPSPRPDAPVTDIEGSPRPVGAGFDIGAYEFQAITDVIDWWTY